MNTLVPGAFRLHSNPGGGGGFVIFVYIYMGPGNNTNFQSSLFSL